MMKTEILSDEQARLASLAHVLRFTGELTCGLQGSRERFPVSSLHDASDKYMQARLESGLGFRDFPNAFVYCKGKKCARISYNGRVWGNDGKEVDIGDGVREDLGAMSTEIINRGALELASR